MPKALKATLFVAVISCSSSAVSGPFADDLGKCLVRSTSEADKTLLVQWMFAMMSLHPKVGALATIPGHRRDELNKGTASLFQGLLTKACNAEARAAFKNEGPQTFEASFNVLGQVAGRELFNDPKVSEGLSGLVRHLDERALKAAFE